MPSLFFCADLRGYGWVVRKGGFVNVGFGRQDRDGFAAHSRAFVAWLAREHEIPAEVPANWCGHAYLLWGQPQRPSVADGVLLVGDAAGLAEPGSGEGIRAAIESGQLAARVIVEAEGIYTRERLQPYRALLEQRHGRPPSARGGEIRLTDRLQQAVAARVAGRPWFARRFLASRFLGGGVIGLRPRAARHPSTRDLRHPVRGALSDVDGHESQTDLPPVCRSG
jgi:flavin-dependent dehydrogenase